MASRSTNLSGKPAWWLLIALLPYLVVSLVRWTEPPAATDGDYAQYLLHAKALVEGRAYSDIGYIYSDLNFVGPPVQPPGWPIVLAPFVAVFGTHSPVFKLLIVFLVGAFGVIAGYYFLRRREVAVGVAVAAVVPLALATDHATGSALSDPLFCVVVWTALVVADHEGPISWRRGLLLTFLAVAAMSIRVAGVALVPALLLFGFWRRGKDRLHVLAPIIALALIGAAWAWQRMEWIPFLDRPLHVMSKAAVRTMSRAYISAMGIGTLYPLWWNRANDIYHLLALVPMAIGGWLFVRNGYRTFLVGFIVAYAGILVLSPVAESRYAWPLVPLMTAWICAGVLWITGRLRTPQPRLLTRRVAAVMGLALVTSAALRVATWPRRYSLINDPDTVALFEWVRATSDTSPMRVVFTNPRVLTLETDVPAMGIPVGRVPDIITEFTRKEITHVVVPMQHRTMRLERDLAEMVAARPSQFAPVFANATHDVRRFIARPEMTTDSGAVTTRSP